MLVPLPETLTPAESTAAGGNNGGVRRKKEFSWAQGNPIGSLLVLFENPTIRRALAIDVIGGVSLAGVQSVQPLFAIHNNNFTTVDNGNLQVRILYGELYVHCHVCHVCTAVRIVCLHNQL